MLAMMIINYTSIRGEVTAQCVRTSVVYKPVGVLGMAINVTPVSALLSSFSCAILDVSMTTIT